MHSLMKQGLLILKNYFRCSFLNPLSTNSAGRTFILENLKFQRGIIRVSGEGVNEIIQGLITNDISHLKGSGVDNSIFTMFLNKQGRVLYDAIIYKNRNESESYLIECDQKIEKQLKQHIMLFRLRKKISVDVITDEMDVWTCFQDKRNITERPMLPDGYKYRAIDEKITLCLDPRLNQLGLRILAPKNIDFKAISEDHYNIQYDPPNDFYNYKLHRFIYGVCEGTSEIPPYKCFPFEFNCDYLHGISFHKGCYLGQEFTARTYHTGKIRKRIMPIIIDSYDGSVLSFEEPIMNEKNQPVGKLKGNQSKYAIGLLRIDLALRSSNLTIGNFNIFTYRPAWWPKN